MRLDALVLENGHVLHYVGPGGGCVGDGLRRSVEGSLDKIAVVIQAVAVVPGVLAALQAKHSAPHALHGALVQLHGLNFGNRASALPHIHDVCACWVCLQTCCKLTGLCDGGVFGHGVVTVQSRGMGPDCD
eukprot:4917815-Pyramimonas_sp.AAC.1